MRFLAQYRGTNVAAMSPAPVPPLELVPGYVLRLIADQITGGQGDEVTSWAGTGTTLTPLTATKPTLTQNFAARKAVVFSTAGASMPLVGSLSTAVTSPSTWHIVFSTETGSSFRVLVDGRDDLGSGRRLVTMNGTLNVNVFAGNFLDAGLVSAGTPNVLTVVFNGGSSSARLNGSETAGNTGTPSDLTDIILGRISGSDVYPFGGAIAEVVAYNSVLSGPEITSNEAALAEFYPPAFTSAAGTDAGNDFVILRPTGLSDATAAPLVIYHHGAGETAASLLSDPLKQGVIYALCAAGYRVVSSTADGENWGNQGGMDAYKSIYDALVGASVNTSRVVFLSQSMGGCTGLNCLADTATWGGVVKGWYGIYPVCDLADMVAAGGFAGAIAAAYPPSGVYTGYNPVAITASVFSGKRLRFTASAGDTVVDKAANADAMSAHVSAHATEYAVVTHTGDHGDPSAFLPSDVVDFFDRCV